MLTEIITDQMKSHFKYRTGFHLWCIRKWSDRIAALNDPRIDRILLDKERDEHDKMKWLEPEYTPYLLISWSYKCKREGIQFDLPVGAKEQLHIATFHHIKNHKHHPEYWDENVSLNALNRDDRDKPSAGQMVDGTRMPLTYIAAMMADWFAMCEELCGHPTVWASHNVNIRWRFKNDQVCLINDLITKVWDINEKA